MNPTPQYLKIGLLVAIPLFLGLIWRGFIALFTGGSNTIPNIGTESGSSNTPMSDSNLSNITPSLGSSNTAKPTHPEIIRIGIPDWFDITTMKDTEQALTSDQITIQRVSITGSDYHDQLYKLMASGMIDLSLIASDRGNNCGQGCALRFNYSQPIDSFLLSPIVDAIHDPYRTMIPYGIDPLVTYHHPKNRVSGAWSAMFNDILVNTNGSSTAGSLPLSIGIGAADQALLRAGKESYPGYAEMIHQIVLQFSINQSLLSQFIQLSTTAQLWSYSRMTKLIETIGDKFPICHQTVAACLVRFNISYYGFGYLTDLMRLPQSRGSAITYDQFPIETNYYPVRMRGFIINQQSHNSSQAVSRFISAYVTSMINIPQPTQSTGSDDSQLSTMSYELLSPFITRFELQGYDPKYATITRYVDSFRIIHGSKSTAIDRARSGGLMSVLDGNSSIQVYLSQQKIN